MMSLARDLEAGFLAEMLKSAGLDQAREALGGGEGESQFSSFLLHEHAKAIVAAGGIGLSEAIYTSLVRKEARE
jgi:Rod binding domain-containing protein